MQSPRVLGEEGKGFLLGRLQKKHGDSLGDFLGLSKPPKRGERH